MAAKVDWIAARAKWESEPTLTHEGLALEIGVSKQAVGKRVKTEGWAKKMVVNKVVSKVVKTSKDNQKKTTKTTKTTKKEIQIESGSKLTVSSGEKKKIGRPTLYKPEYAEQAGEFCLMGATDATLAVRFEVNELTINRWKIDHPDFCKSIRENKDIADAKMAGALYKSGMGLHFIEEDKAISNGEGGQEVVTLRKQIEPSVAAQRHWLNNRQGANWKDRQEVTTTIKLDKELLAQIESQFISRMLSAHERQRAILIERGITIDQE